MLTLSFPNSRRDSGSDDQFGALVAKMSYGEVFA